MSTARVTGPGVLEMELLAVKLKEADPALRRALYKQLRDELNPVADAVRRSALDMPAYKYRDRGLRDEVAATITTSASVTKTGVRATISSLGKRMPPGKENLPAYMNRARGWRHPVFGHRDRWVRQQARAGWFEDPVLARAGELHNACQRAINDIARDLT